MFDFLRTRLAQRGQPPRFPAGEVSFPERFRGRPTLTSDGCTWPYKTPGNDAAPSSLIRTDVMGRAVLDLGACLFSPEEAVGRPGCGVTYGSDFRMSSNTRDGLVSPSGEISPASALETKMQQLLGRSLRLRSVSAGGCGGCEAELVALGNVVFDMARFGVQFVSSPRHADGILITGTVNANMRAALEQTYAAVADPRLVIAVGACAASGGPFRRSEEAGGGAPPSIPVDLWIAGCPPHPLTILDGLLRLLGRIEAGDRSPAAVAAPSGGGA